MRYALKPVNGQTFMPLDAGTLCDALGEAEKLILKSQTKDIMAVWEYERQPHRMCATWVPGRGGWTNM